MGPEKYIKNYLDGAMAPAGSGRYLDNLNPATGKVYSQFPDSGQADLDRAVEAAQRAFPAWAALDPQRRFRLLMRLGDILEQNLELFAHAETIDTGKPLSMSRSVDIPKAQACFRFYAAALLHQPGSSFHQPGLAVDYTLRQAIGVVGCLSHWNLPLYLLCSLIAPALAAGNCVVAKASELAPMTAFLLAKAALDAGFPAGVLNIIHGSWENIGAPLVEDPRIRALAFIGDRETGQWITLQTGPLSKKLSLNLGGKNACIVFKDSDFDGMMIGALRSAFSNNGQINYCTPRIYVERPLYTRFCDEFVKRTQFLRVGDPFSSVTDLGALISADQLRRVEQYLSLAEMEGGRIICGGNRFELPGEFEEGYFIRPAVVEGLSLSSRLNQEDIFGPVATIAPFDTEEEALALANGTPFGLAASVWTRDIGRANRLAERLQAGIIWINGWMSQDLQSPFARLKGSGLDWEGGLEQLFFFTDTKRVSVKF